MNPSRSSCSTHRIAPEITSAAVVLERLTFAIMGLSSEHSSPCSQSHASPCGRVGHHVYSLWIAGVAIVLVLGAACRAGVPKTISDMVVAAADRLRVDVQTSRAIRLRSTSSKSCCNWCVQRHRAPPR